MITLKHNNACAACLEHLDPRKKFFCITGPCSSFKEEFLSYREEEREKRKEKRHIENWELPE